MSTAVRLIGDLDVSILESALNDVMARHEALRTGFEIVDGIPLPVIAPSGPQTLPVVDLSSLPAERRSSEASRLIDAIVQRPFDMAQRSLVRARLFRVSADEHLLLLVTHHIVADSWSMDVVARELSALYNARKAGIAPSLPPLSIQYTDYAAWQRKTLAGELLDEQLAYWRVHLADAPLLELPTRRARPALETHVGATHRFIIPPPLASAIAGVCRREGMTTFMILFGAFGVLLARYSGQTDLVIGTPISLRRRVELEPLVGFFLNTVALPLDLSGDPSIEAVLHRARDVALEAYAHQGASFAALIAELESRRDLARAPLFQVLLMVDDAVEEPWTFDGIQAIPEPVESGTSKFDVTLHVRRRLDWLEAAFEYNTDLFDARFIERLASHFLVVVEDVTADPSRRFSELSVLSDGERAELLGAWKTADDEGALDARVHDAFEAQVRHIPHATAIECGELRVTYDELNRRATDWPDTFRPSPGLARGSASSCLGRWTWSRP